MNAFVFISNRQNKHSWCGLSLMLNKQLISSDITYLFTWICM